MRKMTLVVDMASNNILHESLVQASNLYNAHKEGYNQGYEEGYDFGYSDGYDKGLLGGTIKGRKNGYEEGYTVGYEEGYTVGYEEGFFAADQSEEMQALTMEVEQLRSNIPLYKVAMGLCCLVAVCSIVVCIKTWRRKK